MARQYTRSQFTHLVRKDIYSRTKHKQTADAPKLKEQCLTCQNWQGVGCKQVSGMMIAELWNRAYKCEKYTQDMSR